MHRKRISKTKKVIVLILVGIFTVGLFWLFGYYYIISEFNRFETEGKFPSKSYENHYAFIVDDFHDEFWLKVYNAAKVKGEENKVYVEMFGEGLQRDYTVEQLFEMAIEAKVDGIIINPTSDKCVALIEEAKNKNIPVVTILDDCNSDSQICFVGTSRYHLGLEYGRQLLNLEELEDKKVMILLEDNEKLEMQKLVVSGIRQMIKGHRFTLTTEKIQKKSAFHAEEDIQAFILNAKKKPDIFICLTGDTTKCTLQSVVELNQVGNINIIGYFDSHDIKDAIRKQIIYSVVVADVIQLGEQAVEVIVQYKDRKGINAIVNVDVYAINQNNVEENESTGK